MSLIASSVDIPARNNRDQSVITACNRRKQAVVDCNLNTEMGVHQMLARTNTRILRFLRSEDGPTTVEYAVLLAMLVGMMIATILYLGVEIQGVAQDNADALTNAID